MRRLAFAALLLLATQLPAAAEEERIVRYVSEVVVQTNGDLEVTETITVRAEQERVKRGLLRNITTGHKDETGKPPAAAIQVLSVIRNGQAENFIVEELENGIRIRIGSADRLLIKGLHTYVVRYRAKNLVRFLQSRDELVWDAVGGGGGLDADEVQASIELPAGAVIKEKRAFFIGLKRTIPKRPEIFAESEYRVVWRTTDRLKAGEGLRVRVTWQKGIVKDLNR